MSIIKKLILGLAVVAMVFGTFGVIKASAITEAEVDVLATALGLTAPQRAVLMSLVNTTGGATASSAPLPPLTMGSSGAEVTKLQNWLISKGFDIPAGATGFFGSQTKTALIAFQTANNISPASGNYGPITAGVVSSMISVMPPPMPPPPPAQGNCPTGMVTSIPSATNNWAACVTPAPVQGNCPIGMVTSIPSATNNWAACVVSAPAQGNCPTGMVTSIPSATNNWAVCVSGTPIPPVGTEGSITTRLASTPAANANIRAQTDVKVYGIEVTANNSDMIVDRFDMQVSVTPVGGSAQNPGIFINTIKAWDGATLLKSWSVTNSNFSKDSSDSDRYHIILSGLGFNVPMGTATKDLTFSYSVNSISSTDVNRTVVVQGYAGNTQNVRSTDTLGLQAYADMSGTANTLTHTFKPVGASTLTVSLNNAQTPKSSNNRVHSTNGATKVKMLAFNALAESGDAIIKKVWASTSATSSAGYPSTLYLCDGADTGCASPLRSVSGGVTVGTVAFTNLSITVPQDTTKVFFIAEDFPSTAASQVASTTLANTGVQFEKPDGSTASSTGGAITSKDQYLFSAFPVFSLNGTPTVTKDTESSSSGATTTLTFTLPLKAKAVGGAMVKPVLGDFILYVASSTATTTLTDAALLKYNGYSPGIGGGTNVYTATTTLSSVSTVINQATTTANLSGLSPTDDTVGDGGEYIFSLQGTLRNRCTNVGFIGGAACGASTPAAGSYRMILVAASSTVGANQFTPEYWALDGLETPAMFIVSS